MTTDTHLNSNGSYYDYGSASVGSDSPNITTRQATPKQWENLANEAIADSGYWKQVARNAQAQRDELLHACRAAQYVVSGSDTSAGAQRHAHAALTLAIHNAESVASNLESEAV